MQKRLIAVLALLAVGNISAKSEAVLSIDSSRVLREAREGRAILAKSEKEKEEIMKLEYTETQKITQARAEIEKGMREGKMTEEALQSKYERLGRLQRKIKYTLESAREDFEANRQKAVVKFRGKVHQAASDLFKKGGCSMVFDRATPGIIFTAEAIDRTDTLIKALNSGYKKSQVTSSLTKNSKKA